MCAQFPVGNIDLASSPHSPPSHSPAPSSSPPLQVEMVSHYGNEHYCPISVFRVIGASLVEEFEYSEARKTIIVAASSDDESGERV